MLMSSGLAAVSTPLQACLKCGEFHLLMWIVYGPAQNFCEKVLTRCRRFRTNYNH